MLKGKGKRRREKEKRKGEEKREKKERKGKRKETRKKKKAATGVEPVLLSAGERSRDNANAFVRACSHYTTRP